jgi:flagellar assembly protein FliH
MSSLATPKEQLTAYQRWELNSFDPVPVEAQQRSQHDLTQQLATGQLEHIRQQAQQEGYAAGYREGNDRAVAETLQLQEVTSALSQELQQFDQRVADELLALALVVSKQVMRQALKLHPELILEVVNEVLGKLPLSHHRARLILHPQDAVLVRKNLGERLNQSNWEIIESAALTRGGCRLEAPECEIDATLERRWQRVVEAIGSDHAWID